MHRIHLKLANNSVFVFKLLFWLLSPVEIKSLQPLGESLKLWLTFQFIGVDLPKPMSKAKSFFFLTFSRATLDLTLFLWTFGLNLAPHTLPEPVAIDFKATRERIDETDFITEDLLSGNMILKYLQSNPKKKMNDALTERFLFLLLHLALPQDLAIGQVFSAHAVVSVCLPLLRGESSIISSD